MTEKAMSLRTAINMAVEALKDYRRRNFAIGHNAYKRGQHMTFTEKDHLSYVRFTKAIDVIAGLSSSPPKEEESKKIKISRLTDEQNAWLNNYYGATCIEPMFLEDLETGLKTFQDAALENIRWYEDHYADAMNSISHNIPQ